MAKSEVTNDQIMQTLSKFADDVMRRFESQEKFNTSQEKFNTSQEKFNTSQEKFNLEFTRRLNGFESELSEIKETMATKGDIRRLQSTMDSYTAHFEHYTMEIAAMQHKINRLERMIDYLADKAGVSKETLEML